MSSAVNKLYYDSTDDNIIEDVIRYNLPVLKETIEKILKGLS